MSCARTHIYLSIVNSACQFHVGAMGSAPWGDAAAGKKPEASRHGVRTAKASATPRSRTSSRRNQCRAARRKMRENMESDNGQDAPRQPLSGPKRKVCDSEDDADSGTRRRAARCTEGTAASVYPPHAYASLAQGLSCCGSVRFGGELLLNDPDKVDVTLGSRSPCSSHELLGMRLKQQPQGCSRR